MMRERLPDPRLSYPLRTGTAHRRALHWGAIMTLVIGTLPAGAEAACSVSAQGVNFGSYDPFDRRDSDSVGIIAVACDSEVAYTLSLSTGAGTYAARRLSDGGHWLAYNLYTDATHLIVWGDGGGASSTVSGIGSVAAAQISVYARIPAGQNAHVGNYVDHVVVTIDF
jgi:spore coat protein U-like protein